MPLKIRFRVLPEEYPAWKFRAYDSDNESCLRPSCVTLAALAADDKWARLKSPNFELYTDGGAGPARDVFEAFRADPPGFRTNLGKKNLASVPVRIFLFRSEPSFRPYRMSEDKNRVAITQAGAERDYIAMQNTGEGSYRTVFHEYAHMIVNHTWPRIPTWCEEGIAEVYSTLRVLGNEVHVGDLIPSHLLVLRENKILDLASLMMIDQSSPYYNEARKAGIFYAESWALTHMLIMSESYDAVSQLYRTSRERHIATGRVCESVRENAR